MYFDAQCSFSYMSTQNTFLITLQLNPSVKASSRQLRQGEGEFRMRSVRIWYMSNYGFAFNAVLAT
jgi:hypothetical protein